MLLHRCYQKKIMKIYVSKIVPQKFYSSLFFWEESEASLQSEEFLRKARKLLYRYMGKQNNWISRKQSVFDIWCIEQKMFVFTP